MVRQFGGALPGHNSLMLRLPLAHEAFAAGPGGVVLMIRDRQLRALG
jgi:hypothetical protein